MEKFPGMSPATSPFHTPTHYYGSDIGLDIDGVLANFAQAVIERGHTMGLGDKFPATWREVDTWLFSEAFGAVWKAVHLQDSFWLDEIQPFDGVREEISFDVKLYATARPIGNHVSMAWLAKHGFPEAPVFTVKNPEEKIPLLLEQGIDTFADDKVETVEELRAAGINGLLRSVPYHRDPALKERIAALPKIYSLSQIIQRS